MAIRPFAWIRRGRKGGYKDAKKAAKDDAPEHNVTGPEQEQEQLNVRAAGALGDPPPAAPGLTAEQCEILQRTWAQVTHRHEDAEMATRIAFVSGGLREFSKESPEGRAIFDKVYFNDDGTLDEKRFVGHATMLTRTLDMLLDMLPDVAAFKARLTSIIQRHPAYGVQPQHFMMQGQQQMAATEEHLGEQWTTEVAAAWGAFGAIMGSTVAEVYAALPAAA